MKIMAGSKGPAPAFITAALAAALILGCGSDAGRRRGSPAMDDAREAVYSGILSDPVRLSDGRYEGEPFVEGGASRDAVLLYDIMATGDMDRDEVDESAFILSRSSGGSGTFIYLCILDWKDGEAVNTATILIGDREQIRSMRIDGGRLEMDVIQHGPDDAMCCPTQKARRTWTLENGSLIESGTSRKGREAGPPL